MSAETIVLPDAESLAADIAARLGRFVAAAQAGGHEPNIVLTGGTIALAAYELRAIRCCRLDAGALVVGR